MAGINKGLQFKHKFKVVSGKFVWDDLEMFKYVQRNLEGKHGYALIEEEEDDISPNQYAYYFGGIIRRECMISNTFAGMTEMEIHQVLFNELRSHTKGILLPDGRTKLVTVMDDFSSFKKADMAKYIEELIPLLNTEYNIWPKPSCHYKDNRFYLKQKTYK